MKIRDLDPFDYLGSMYGEASREELERNEKNRGTYLLYGAVAGVVGVAMIALVNYHEKKQARS